MKWAALKEYGTGARYMAGNGRIVAVKSLKPSLN